MKMPNRRIVLTAIVTGLLLAWVVLSSSLPVYTYESSDRGMAEIEVPWKGRDLKTVESLFNEYKEWKNDPSITLCRTCNRPWGALNLWWDNLTNRRWRYSYMTPSKEPNDQYYTQMTIETNTRRQTSQPSR